MKMYLMPFDEARKTLSEAYPMSVKLTNKSLFGIEEKSIPWGKKVEVNIDTLSNRYYIPTYQLNGFSVPTRVFANPNDVLRYGTILTDDELFDRCDDMAAEVRIRLFSYKSVIYYIKMINGEVEEFKKVGTDEH